MGLLDAAAGAITGGTSQKLEKLSVLVEGDNNNLENPFRGVHPSPVMFNPASITHTIGATYTETPIQALHISFLNFLACPLDTLDIELYFDTTEPVDDGTGSSSGVVDVRRYSSVIAGLARTKRNAHRPPLCQLAWGNTDSSGYQWFIGVTTRVVQAFTYFHRNGTPLRAKLACSLKQWAPDKPTTANEQHSSDVFKSYMVRRGDTIASIAKEMLHEAAQWRLIATANGITDPLDLAPGRVLKIPTVGRS